MNRSRFHTKYSSFKYFFERIKFFVDGNHYSGSKNNRFVVFFRLCNHSECTNNRWIRTCPANCYSFCSKCGRQGKIFSHSGEIAQIKSCPLSIQFIELIRTFAKSQICNTIPCTFTFKSNIVSTRSCPGFKYQFGLAINSSSICCCKNF